MSRMFDPGWPEEITPNLESIGPTRPEQLSLIAGCVDVIDQQIPLSPPLWKACPRAAECWRRDPGPPPPPHFSARIPYVGPGYPETGIAVVAINSRDSGRAGDEVHTAAQVVANLRLGRREYGRHSFFHYRVAATVDATLRSLAGETVEAPADPVTAAAAVAASARLQAVQCSPQSSSRQGPTGAMTRNCPEFLLRGQLEVLAPRVLMLFGGPAHRAIERPKLDVDWEVKWADSRRCFSRGRAHFRGADMIVLAFHHPSHTGWRRSWDAYLTSLRTQQLVYS